MHELSTPAVVESAPGDNFQGPSPDSAPGRRDRLSTILLFCFCSLLTVAFAAVLNQWIVSERVKNQRAMHIVKLAKGRWVRAQNVAMNVNSTKYDSRWDAYINDSVIIWTQDYHIMVDAIDRYFPEARPLFDQVHGSFLELHALLLVIHRSGASLPPGIAQDTREALRRVNVQVVELAGYLSAHS